MFDRLIVCKKNDRSFIDSDTSQYMEPFNCVQIIK